MTISINFDTGCERKIKDVNLMDTDGQENNIHRVKIIELKNNWIEVELMCGRCFAYDDANDYKNEKTKNKLTCKKCILSLQLN